MADFKLILVDPKHSLCADLQKAFGAYADVLIVNGRFEDLEIFDCMVSAANSFGLMDGGVDLAIVNYFGRGLEQSVQAHILREYWGEQPVGTAFIIETKHPKHPFLAHTPTMRVPMDISETANVYQAMLSMLVAVHHHNQRQPQNAIRTLACPGLGTQTGRVPGAKAARQMALAYECFLRPTLMIDWEYATKRNLDVLETVMF